MYYYLRSLTLQSQVLQFSVRMYRMLTIHFSKNSLPPPLKKFLPLENCKNRADPLSNFRSYNISQVVLPPRSAPSYTLHPCRFSSTLPSPNPFFLVVGRSVAGGCKFYWPPPLTRPGRKSIFSGNLLSVGRASRPRKLPVMLAPPEIRNR